VVNDQSAHHPRGISHESALVRKSGAIAVPRGHVEVSLMQKRACADADGSAVARQFAPGQTVQLGIKSGK
jgi:hypothetical protein